MNRLDILSNNLANADTNGYKKEGATNQTFADELGKSRLRILPHYGMPQTWNHEHGGTQRDLGTDWLCHWEIPVTDNSTDFALDGWWFLWSLTQIKCFSGNTSVKYSRDGVSCGKCSRLSCHERWRDYVLQTRICNECRCRKSTYSVDPNLPITVDEKGIFFRTTSRSETGIGVCRYRRL